MAEKFILTAQLQLQSPRNVKTVVRNIRKELSGIKVPVEVNIKGRKEVQKLTKDLERSGRSAKKASSGISSFGKAVNQVSRDLTRIGSLLLLRQFGEAARGALEFERELIKVSQVTGTSIKNLSGLKAEIVRLSTSLGVSSKSLVEVSRVLSQTGISAKETRIALESLAKTTLAPTFTDIKNTTETAIAAMKQFKLEAKDLSTVLSQINSIAGQFAVEAGDIGVAIRRAGGVFQKAGGQLTELEALFTSVRSTTRESAETIATGFRTIFTRIQRPRTLKFLRQMGIELTDLKGKFIGPFEAVKRLSIALKDLDPRDIRFAQITEQLGGFRQVSKVIPLIKEFAVSQRALNVARAAGNSLDRDTATAQDALLVRLTKVKESFNALIRSISDNSSIKLFITSSLRLADALLRVTKALEPLLPLITGLATLGIAKGIGRLTGGVRGRHGGGRIHKFDRGGFVPGHGNGDTVPAMLQPGEFVIKKSSAQGIGSERLHGLNRRNRGGPIRRYGDGTGKRGVTPKPIKVKPPTLNSDGRVRGEGRLPTPDEVKAIRQTGDPTQVNIANNVSATAKAQAKETPRQKQLRQGRERRGVAGTLKLRIRENQYGGIFLNPQEGADRTVSPKSVSVDTGQKKYLAGILATDPKASQLRDKALLKRLIANRIDKTSLASVQFDASHLNRSLRKRIVQGLAPKTTDMISSLVTGTASARALKKIGLSVNKTVVKTRVGDQIRSGSFPLEELEGNVFESFVGAITGTPLSEKKASWDFPNLNTGAFSKLFIGMNPRLKHGEAKRTRGSDSFGKQSNNIGAKFARALEGKAGPANVSLKELGYDKAALTAPNTKIGQALAAQASGAKGAGAGRGRAAAKRLGGIMKRLTSGGSAGTDTVPALLTPGEFVINKGSSERIGYSRLNRMNKTGEFASGGRVGRYAQGGPVPTRGSGSAFGGTGERQAGGGFEKLFVLTAVAGQLSAQFEGMNEATKKLVDRLTQFAILLVALQAVGSPRKFAGAGVGTAGGGVFGIGRLTGEDVRGFAGSEGIDLREGESGKKAMKARQKARAGARAAKVEKIGGRTQLGFAAASAAALTFGESLKGAAQKSIQSARTEEEGSAAIGQASRAAAVSMGGLGAAIGAQFGPIGAAVGGVVGVLFGLFTAGEAARKQLETLKFKRQFEEFEKALVLAGKKGVDATTQSARISKGIADAQSRFFKAADDENVKELNNSLRRTLPTLDTYIQKVVSSAQSFEDLRRTVGDNVIKEFNRLTGQTLAQFRKQIEGEIEARKKSKEVQEKLSNAQEEVFRKVLLARGVASALTDLKAAAGSLVLGFKTIGQSLAGQFGRVEVFDALKGLGAPSEISDLQDFNQKISVATGIMGEAGIILGTEAKSFASVFANLPDILSQAVQQPVFEGDEGDLVAKVMKKIDGLGSVSELTRRRIQGQLEELAGGEDPGKLREAIRSDLNGLVKSLASGSSSIFKALQQGASFIDLSTKKFSSAFNQRTKAEALIAKRRLALSTFTLQKQQALAKATGTEINLEKIFNDFQTATNQLLAGTRVSNLGGNVDAIGDELARLKENIKKKRDEINDIPIDAGGENELRRRQKLIDETEKLQENFSKVSAALDRFANAQQRLGAVQKELSKEQKKRQQVFGAAAQFTFGGRDQRQQQQQAFFFTKLAAITGNINKVPDEFKGAVSGLLSQLKDIKLFGGQETGKEIKTRLVANQLRQLGVPPDLIKAITKRTSKEQDLIDKLRVVFEEAERARSAQLETLVDDRKRLLQDLRSLNRQLLTGLQKLLLGQAKRFEESEKTAIEDAKTRTEQGKASIQELRKLTTTDTGKELDDSQIETLRSQKGAFVEAQKAAKRNADSINSAVAFARQLEETNAGDRIVGESGIMQITGDAFGGGGDRILRSGEELEKVVDNIEKGLTRLFGAQFADDFVKEFRSKLTGAQKRGGRIDLSTVNKILVSQFTEFAKKTKETNDAIIQNASDLGTSLGFSAEQISRFTENANKINDVLSRIPIGATVTSLNSELIRLDTKLRQVNDNLEGIVDQQAEGGTAATPGLRLQTRSRGGIIYASDGGFTPRGTDVVPAMLSAGEFVVNKKATQANLPALQSMNSGGKVGYYQAGGVVDVPARMQLGALGNGPTKNQLSDIYANGVRKLFDTLINEVGLGKVINPYWRHLGLSEGLPVEADRFNSNSLRGYADVAGLFGGVPESGETNALVFKAVKKALGNDPDTVPSLLLYGGQRREGRTTGRQSRYLDTYRAPMAGAMMTVGPRIREGLASVFGGDPVGLGQKTGAIDENGFPLDLAEFRAREARGGRIFSTFGALRNSKVFGRGIDWPKYFGSEYSYDPEGTTRQLRQLPSNAIYDTSDKLKDNSNQYYGSSFLLEKFSEGGVHNKLSEAYGSQLNYVNRFGANYLASNFGSEKAIKASRDENLADTLINDFVRLGLEPLQDELLEQIFRQEGEDFYNAGTILGIGDFATLRGIGEKRSRSGVPYFGMDLPKDVGHYALAFKNELESKIQAGLLIPAHHSFLRVGNQVQQLGGIADRPDTASLISSIYENYGIGSIAGAVTAEAEKQRKDQEVADAEIEAARMGNINIASDGKLKAVIQNNIKRYRNDGTLGRLAGNPYGKVVPTVDKGDALSLIPTLISMRDLALTFDDVLKKADRQSFEIDTSGNLRDKENLLEAVNAGLEQFPIYGGTRGKFELRSTKQILDGKIEGPLKVLYDGLITARQRLSADTGKGKIQFTGADGSIQEMFVQNAGAKDIYGYYGITKTEFRSYPIQKKKQLQNAFRSKQKAQTLSAGGPVYLAGGGFSPRGTDTVPAMLTPGEFVVNRKSTQANLPLLKSINSMSSGGVAYLAEGSGFNGALGLGLSRVDYVVEQERSRDELKGIKNELVVIKTVLIAQYSHLNRSFKQLAFSIDPKSSGFSKFAMGAPMGAGAPNPKFLNPSRGGHIPMYAKKGTLIPYEPKGTDTVPAMLTPGEFVIRKSAVDAIGVGNLQRLNSTGYAKGGHVGGVNYLQAGGKSVAQTEGEDIEGLKKFIEELDRHQKVTRFLPPNADIKKLPARKRAALKALFQEENPLLLTTGGFKSGFPGAEVPPGEELWTLFELYKNPRERRAAIKQSRRNMNKDVESYMRSGETPREKAGERARTKTQRRRQEAEDKKFEKEYVKKGGYLPSPAFPGLFNLGDTDFESRKERLAAIHNARKKMEAKIYDKRWGQVRKQYEDYGNRALFGGPDIAPEVRKQFETLDNRYVAYQGNKEKNPRLSIKLNESLKYFEDLHIKRRGEGAARWADTPQKRSLLAQEGKIPYFAHGGPVLGSVTGRPANLYTQRASGRTRKYSVAGTKGAGRQSWITHDMDIWKKHPKLRAEGQPEGFVYESAGRTTSRMKSQEEIDNMGFWAGAWEAAKRPDPSDLVNPMAFGKKGVTTLIGRLTRKVKHVRGIKQIRNLRAGATRGIKRVLKIGLGSTPDPVKTRPPDMGDYIYPEPEGHDESAFNIGQTMMRLLRGEVLPQHAQFDHSGRLLPVKDSPRLMKVGTRIRRSADAVGMQAGLTRRQAGIQRGLIGSLAETSEEGASVGMAGMVSSAEGILDISGVATPFMDMNPSSLGRGFHTHLSEGITELGKTNPELAQEMFKMHELVKRGKGTLDDLLGGSLEPAGGSGSLSSEILGIGPRDLGIRPVKTSPKFAAMAQDAMKDTIQQEMMATYRHEIQHLYSKAYAATVESGRYAREGGPKAVSAYGFAQEYSKASQNRIMDLFIPKGLDNTSSKGLNTLVTAQHGRTSRLHNLIESFSEFDRSMLYHYLFGSENLRDTKQGAKAFWQPGRFGAEPDMGMFREELASYTFAKYGSKGREGLKELAKVTGLGEQESMYLIEHMTNIQRTNRAIGPIGIEGGFWQKSQGLFTDDFLNSPAGKDFKKFGPAGPTGGPVGEFEINESMIDILLNNPHTPGGKMGLPERGVSGEEFFRRAGVNPFAPFDTSGGYVSTVGERAPGTEWFLPRPSKTSQYIMGRPAFGRKHGGPVGPPLPVGWPEEPDKLKPSAKGGLPITGRVGRRSAYQHGETPLSASSKRTGGRRPTWEIWADTVLHQYRNRTADDLSLDEANGLEIARGIDSGKLHGMSAFQAYRSVTGSRTRSRVLNYGVAGMMGGKSASMRRKADALRKAEDKGFGAASTGRRYHRLHDLGQIQTGKRAGAIQDAHRSITGVGSRMLFSAPGEPGNLLPGAIPIGGVMPQSNVRANPARRANIAAARKHRRGGSRTRQSREARIRHRRWKKARVKARGQEKRNMRRRRRGGLWRAKGGPVFDPRYKLGWSADRGMLRSQRETQSDEENADFSAYGEGVDPGWHQRQHFRRGLRRAFPDLWDMSIVKPRGKAPEFKLMPTDEMFGDTDRNQDPMSKSYLQDPRNRRRRAIQNRKWMEFQRRKKEALDKAKQKGVESWMRGSGPKVRNTPSRSRMITDPRLSRQGFNKGGGVGYFKTGGHVSPIEKAQRLHRKEKRFDEEQKLDDMDAIYRMMRSFDDADIDRIPGLRDQIQKMEQIDRFNYAKGGGVDSVPAMLTPGEFVINRQAATALGRSSLENINRAKGFNRGGAVKYLQAGGEVDGGMELSPLFNAITNLQWVLDGRLSELIKKIPLATEGTQNIFAIEDFRSSVDRLNAYSGFGLFHEAVSILAGIGPFQIEIPGGISVNLGAFEASLRVELKNIVMTAVKQAMGSLEIDMPDQGPDGRPNKPIRSFSKP